MANTKMDGSNIFSNDDMDEILANIVLPTDREEDNLQWDDISEAALNEAYAAVEERIDTVAEVTHVSEESLMWEAMDDSQLVNVTVQAEEHAVTERHAVEESVGEIQQSNEGDKLQWEAIDTSQLIEVTIRAEENVDGSGIERPHIDDDREGQEFNWEETEASQFMFPCSQEHELDTGSDEHAAAQESAIESVNEVEDEEFHVVEEEVEEEEEELEVGNSNILLSTTTSETSSTSASSEEIRCKMVRDFIKRPQAEEESPDSGSSGEIRRGMIQKFIRRPAKKSKFN